MAYPHLVTLAIILSCDYTTCDSVRSVTLKQALFAGYSRLRDVRQVSECELSAKSQSDAASSSRRKTQYRNRTRVGTNSRGVKWHGTTRHDGTRDSMRNGVTNHCDESRIHES
jgi:hypothetical protein